MKKIISRIFNSTTVLVLGILVLISGANPGQYGNLATGFLIIIGTLAYRSAKKRIASGSKNNTKFTFEIIAMIIIVLSIVLQNNLADAFYENPFSNIIIPIILIGSYVHILRKK
jgi:glycerol uptake facilitator-like aquaporin